MIDVGNNGRLPALLSTYQQTQLWNFNEKIKSIINEVIFHKIDPKVVTEAGLAAILQNKKGTDDIFTKSKEVV